MSTSRRLTLVDAVDEKERRGIGSACSTCASSSGAGGGIDRDQDGADLRGGELQQHPLRRDWCAKTAT